MNNALIWKNFNIINKKTSYFNKISSDTVQTATFYHFIHFLDASGRETTELITTYILSS